MGIRKIDYSKCDSCMICVDICPMDVIRADERTKKPFVKYLTDCMSCFICEMECPQKAIYVTPVRERRIPLPWEGV
jgi:NAD-dependent dihydropyrimidine dehydrogenase PreA subunit